ncbi:unnamed protein product [Chondrus crispus]|uniref:Uncharacterized protein n=1 Tax=Chondrus crispus TaxID=2769 RepID=R7Q5X5_CHOCR|nr:unnamed protein product [Chondrus crispus]CDF33414.1 unnamed protein product [Chondrus crispus]|eukprot:XP_005713217.1 unnamed protein product [Chondrus crispus]
MAQGSSHGLSFLTGPPFFRRKLFPRRRTVSASVHPEHYWDCFIAGWGRGA